MSLATNITNLATRIATEVKALRTMINGNAASLTGLTTTNKTNLVAAINEVKGSISAAGPTINDAGTATNEVWSSTKTNTSINTAVSNLVASAPATLDTLDELSAALADDANFATTMTTALGNRVRVDAAQGLSGPQQVQARANIAAGTSNLVIGTTTGTAADAALLATSLASKANAAHTHVAADISNSTTVGRSVLTAVDAPAARTAIGAGTGSSNLVIGTIAGTAADAGALATSLNLKEDKTAIGNPETDFVATFNTGLV